MTRVEFSNGSEGDGQMDEGTMGKKGGCVVAQWDRPHEEAGSQKHQ